MDWANRLVSYGWILFWLYWFMAAAGAKKEVRANRLNTRWPRLIFFILLVIVLFTSYAKLFGLNHQIAQSNYAVKIVGVVIFYSGLALAVWARRHLGNDWGMPMSVKINPRLVTSGPYRLVRHPIYSGLLLAILGTMVVKDIAWLLFFIMAAGFVVYSSVKEEKLLARQFPKTYPAYKRRTKMLIPYII